MTKQEFLAMSLPFGLKMCLTMNLDDDFYCDYYFDTKLLQKGTIWDLSGIYNGDSYISVGDAELCDLVLEKNGTWITLLLGDAKPILRPLSDLTKEIEHNGKKIIPLLELKWNRTINGFTKSNIDAAMSSLSLKDAIKLIEWHIDIAGLIDKGEVIDVNTLQENPYK